MTSRVTKYLASCFERASDQYGPLTGIGVSISERAKTIAFHFNSGNEIDASILRPSQFEHQDQYRASYHTIVGEHQVRQDVWDATKLVALPTTLCCFDDETKNFFALHTELETFGRFVVKHFREHVMQDHDEQLQRLGINKNSEPALNIREDITLDPAKRHALTSEFFKSLTDDQLSYLRSYVLRAVDAVAFNVMKAFDEQTGAEDSTIEVRSHGINAVDLPLIGNGNLSGEYLDWVTRFSKFGRFQR